MAAFFVGRKGTMIHNYPKVYFGENDENHTSRSITAEVTGTVIFEETDLGPWVPLHAPGADEDYETFSTLTGEAVEKLIIELMKDKFSGHVEFRQYLAEKDIPYTFFSF